MAGWASGYSLLLARSARLGASGARVAASRLAHEPPPGSLKAGQGGREIKRLGQRVVGAAEGPPGSAVVAAKQRHSVGFEAALTAHQAGSWPASGALGHIGGSRGLARLQATDNRSGISRGGNTRRTTIPFVFLSVTLVAVTRP